MNYATGNRGLRKLKSAKTVQALRDVLRALRDRVAVSEGRQWNTYHYVFKNEELDQLAADQPQNREEFLDIKGVKHTKCNKYYCFVDEINRFLAQHQPPQLSNERLAVLLMVTKLREFEAMASADLYDTIVASNHEIVGREEPLRYLAFEWFRHCLALGIANRLELPIDMGLFDSVEELEKRFECRTGIQLNDEQVQLRKLCDGEPFDDVMETVGILWAIESHADADRFFRCRDIRAILRSGSDQYPFNVFSETDDKSDVTSADTLASVSDTMANSSETDSLDDMPSQASVEAILERCANLSERELTALIVALMNRWSQLREE